LSDTSSGQDGLGSDTGLLEKDGGLDGSSSDNHFSSGLSVVGGSGLISELDSSSSWGRIRGEKGFSDGSSGEDWTSAEYNLVSGF
jgi:hypothetical protein